VCRPQQNNNNDLMTVINNHLLIILGYIDKSRHGFIYIFLAKSKSTTDGQKFTIAQQTSPILSMVQYPSLYLHIKKTIGNIPPKIVYFIHI